METANRRRGKFSLVARSVVLVNLLLLALDGFAHAFRGNPAAGSLVFKWWIASSLLLVILVVAEFFLLRSNRNSSRAVVIDSILVGGWCLLLLGLGLYFAGRFVL